MKPTSRKHTARLTWQPQVIRDLTELSDYAGKDGNLQQANANYDAADARYTKALRALIAAEEQEP